MKLLKILSGVIMVFLTIAGLLMMSLQRKQKIPVRFFERNYVLLPEPEKMQLDDLTDAPERIDVVNNLLLLSTRSEKSITVSRLGEDNYFQPAAVMKQEGLIINWQLQDEILFNADSRKRMIHLRDLRSNQSSTYPIRMPFSRIIRMNDSLCLLKGRDASDLNDNYTVYNYRSGAAKTFGNLLSDYNDGGFVNDGYFISDGHSRFYHICYYVSDIIAFDGKGHPLYKTVSVDKVSELPKTIVSRSGSRFISSETPVIHPAAAASREFVFILSSVRSESDEKSQSNEGIIVDIYNADKGNYRASVRLNGVTSVRSLACGSNKLYYLSADHIGSVDISSLRSAQVQGNAKITAAINLP